VVDFRLSSEGSGRAGGSVHSLGLRFRAFWVAQAVLCLLCSIPALVCAQTQAGANQGPAVIITGLNLPSAIASDSQGNLYVVDEGCGIPAVEGDCNVYKESLSGGAWTQSRVAAFTSANLPTSVAVDAGGNVYIGVTGKGLYRETPSGRSYTESTIGCAFAKPKALAFDGKDSFFVADAETGRVYREKAGDSCATATVVASLTNVTGVAVDSCGNVYVAESTGAASIVKETPSQGGYLQSSVGSGMAALIGVAVDAHQDVYYSDVSGSVSVWVPGAQGYTQHAVMTGLPLSPIGGMAIDAANNLYFADFTNSRVWKAVPAFALPPSPPCGAAPAPPAGAKATAQGS
jgi:sugar lactone lactonase YvrE